jgi:type II secretory pathway component PulC
MMAPTPIPAAAKPVDTAPSASAFKLVGTVMAADGADSFALVRRTADSQLVRLRAGDRVEGLTVSAIEPDSVVLAGAAQAIVIEAGRTAAAPTSPVPSRAVSPPPEPEPAWAGDPAPFGH